MLREWLFFIACIGMISVLSGCASFRTPRENNRADVIDCTKDMLGYINDGELAFKICNSVQKEY
jgi:hypothetical protein